LRHDLRLQWQQSRSAIRVVAGILRIEHGEVALELRGTASVLSR
jgi:hypothetical protein